MILSKLWLFFITLIAAAALTGLLLVPKVADRERAAHEHQGLVTACSVGKILLTNNAQARVDFAAMLAREPELVTEVESLLAVDLLAKDQASKLRTLVQSKLPKQDENEPDLIIVTDQKGRVLSRLKTDEDVFGDVIAGRPLVDQALHGYEADDVWVAGEKIFLVAAAPIIRRDAPMRYVGALIMGRLATGKFADKLAGSLRAGVLFTLGGTMAGASPSVVFDRTAIERLASGIAADGDCAKQTPGKLTSGPTEYLPLASRLPGEAGELGALTTVFMEHTPPRGLIGTLKAAQKSDIGLVAFPWWLVVGAFCTLLLASFLLLRKEAERPLKALATDAIKLAQGDMPRLSEDAHKGAFGSIARSLNIHIDKLGRDAKSANANLDSLLIAGDAKLGALDLTGGAGSLGPPAPAQPAAGRSLTPPPIEFKFSDAASKSPMASAAPSMPLPPVPSAGAGKPKPPTPNQKLVLDDLILSDDKSGDHDSEEAHFEAVFAEFLRVREQCGEGAAGLTMEKFREKLLRNRDDLIAKTGCARVKFSVYVKDGKAALKASPVKG